MRKWLLFLSGFFACFLSMADISLSDVRVFSGSPWKDVLIGYSVSGAATEDLQLSVVASNVTTGAVIPCRTVENADLAEGRHVACWRAQTDGVRLNSETLVFRLAVVRSTEPSSSPAGSLYRVVDLTRLGNASAVYPLVEDLDAIPKGGWTNEHKTKKLVLRRIDGGSFSMGSPAEESGRASDETAHAVRISRAFYMGVFEVTQYQYELVMGKRPSNYAGDARPVESVAWTVVRGTTSGSGASAIGGSSFLGLLRSKSKLDFELPTEAQWEYACRAGTSSAYNGGADANLAQLGQYAANKASKNGGFSEHTTVGSFKPNAWGLYDMHGNVAELCLDRYGAYGTGDVEDPTGAASGTERVIRGGGWNSQAAACRSASRATIGEGDSSKYVVGFRVVCAIAGDAAIAPTAPVETLLAVAESDPVTVDTSFEDGTEVDSPIEIPYGLVGADGPCRVTANGEEIVSASEDGSIKWKISPPQAEPGDNALVLSLTNILLSSVVRPYSSMISFDAGGKCANPEPISRWVGFPYGDLPQVSADGWEFEGWTLGGDIMGAAVLSNDLVAAREVALLAKWNDLTVPPEVTNCTFVYDGKVHLPSFENAEIVFAVNPNDEFVPGEELQGVCLDSGQYNLYYRMTFNGSPASPGEVTVTIEPRPLTEDMVDPIPAQVQDGPTVIEDEYGEEIATIRPDVVIRFNGEVLESYVDYTTSFPAELVTADAGAVVVSALDGNFAGSVTQRFVIVSSPIEAAFYGFGRVADDGSGGWRVTLTNGVAARLEVPDNLGAVTLDLAGADLIGAAGAVGSESAAGEDGHPGIRIRRSDVYGEPTVLRIVNSESATGGSVVGGDGGAGAPPGKGAQAWAVDQDARNGATVVADKGIVCRAGADGENLLVRIELDVPEIPAREYDGGLIKAGVDDSEHYTVIGDDGWIDAGTNDIVFVLNDPSRYAWKGVSGATAVRPFIILPASLSDVEVEEIPAQPFDGTPVEPEVSTSWPFGQLVRDVDYRLEYFDNDAEGDSARVVMTGIGNFTGTVERRFSIGYLPRPERRVEFVDAELAVAENSRVTVRVYGGVSNRTSSVKVYLKYTGAASADLDLKKTLVNGKAVNAKTFKFPVTLKWAADEIGVKTISLLAKRDSTSEGPERLTLQLGGELGLEPGERRTCSVVIGDLSANALKTTAKNPSKTKGVKKFAVTTLSADETMGVVSPSNSWYKGAKVTVRAQARTGCAFAGWYDLATGRKVSSKTSYAFTVSKEVTLEARFSKRFYLRVLADPVDGGTASGSGWYAKGKLATLKAVRKSHFKFLGWYAVDADDANVVGTNRLSGSATYKPTVTNDCTIYARFQSEPRLELFNNNSKGGTVKGANKYAVGKTVKLTAKPKKGYAFVGWTDFDGNRKSSATTYSYTMTADGVVFRANFVKESQLLAPRLNWSATNLTVGVSYSVAPKAFGAEASEASGVDGAAAVKVVSVSGLPKGLAWKSGKVTGVPTVAGAKTVSVKVALATNAKKYWTLKQRLVVSALPAWAKGTYVGGSETCAATLTVGSTGKASGKICFANAVWTLSGTKISKLDTEAKTATLSLTAKKGKTKKTVAIAVSEDELGGWMESAMSGFAFEARQNRWKTDDEWIACAADLVERTFTDEASGLVVTFKANGVATATLRSGSSAFTATATLSNPDGVLHFYFAPNTKKKFKGAVKIVAVDTAVEPLMTE